MNIVKYPGGKERELGIIQSNFPPGIKNYYEPFVGGGAVYLSTSAEHYYVNDISEGLMNLYRCVASQDTDFFSSMAAINSLWKSIDAFAEKDDELFRTYIGYRDSVIDKNAMKKDVHDYISKNRESIIQFVKPLNCGGTDVFPECTEKILIRKFVSMKKLNFIKRVIPDEDILANILGAYKAAFYTYIRSLFNRSDSFTDGMKAMLYLFIRDFCYSSMFRFNDKGEYNVPYGGLSYNKKTYDRAVEKYQDPELLSRMSQTTFGCMDYMDFLSIYPPQENDFMFIDPPYDSSFSTYDQKPFDTEQQELLAGYLISQCRCRFMIDIKYTDYIASLYPEGLLCANGGTLRVKSFDKNYSVSFMNRNSKEATHMLICNY